MRTKVISAIFLLGCTIYYFGAMGIINHVFCVFTPIGVEELDNITVSLSMFFVPIILLTIMLLCPYRRKSGWN